jgi:hypothetical protein
MTGAVLGTANRRRFSSTSRTTAISCIARRAAGCGCRAQNNRPLGTGDHITNTGWPTAHLGKPSPPPRATARAVSRDAMTGLLHNRAIDRSGRLHQAELLRPQEQHTVLKRPQLVVLPVPLETT